jgi:hypothetical protein
MQDSQGFAVNTLVKVDFEPHPLFFRILALDHARNQLQVPHRPYPHSHGPEQSRLESALRGCVYVCTCSSHLDHVRLIVALTLRHTSVTGRLGACLRSCAWSASRCTGSTRM